MRPWGQNGGGARRTTKRLIGTLVAAVAVLALPASAQANLNLTGSHAEPTNLQAGFHSDFKIHVQFGSENVKDLTISLPPGEVGDPQATPLCNPGDLPNCDPSTAVGSVSSSVTIASLLPQTINGTVFNLVPNPGEPARFGIVLNALPITLPVLGDVLLPPTVVQSGASLRSDFGLDTIVKNIPETATVLPGIDVPIHINSMDLTLNGMAGGKSFMRNPTSCGAHTVRFSGNSHSSSTIVSQDSPSFTTTGCDAEDFSPSFTARVGGPGQTASGVPTTVVTSIDQDLDEAGLKRAAVTVPSDFNPNGSLLGTTCAPASFQASACPPASVVGSAVAGSPLLSQPLSGPVVLVTTSAGLPNLGLDLQGQLHLLLQGSVDVNKTVVFGDIAPGLPDIPIAHFELSFPSSPGFLGNVRDMCVGAPPVFHADFRGYNDATTSVDAPATIVGCGAGSGKGGTKGKCKKAKKKHKKHHAASAAKKHKKKSCKKKKRKKHRR